MATKERMPLFLFVERILSAMIVLGLTLLCIGVPLHTVGRASDNLFFARVGAYILLIGTALIVIRIFYWIAEKIVGRELESVAKQNTISCYTVRASFLKFRLTI